MPKTRPDHVARQHSSKHMPTASSFFAFVGGVCASLGSVGAKLAVVSGEQTAGVSMAVHEVFPAASPRTVDMVSRVLMVGFVGVCNFLMWLFFTKALRYGDSTARVMMVQTVSNFAATAVLGVQLFGDALSLRWWSGASLIAVGLVFLQAEVPDGYPAEEPDGSVKHRKGEKDSKKTS
ncbi:Transmembrane protein 42 [Coemansia sp. RSA 1813]|nr:Transmembrane protein 42 [Coemansia sp. RSA 1646]KAJ1771064.1 Transmembrane protein 42 [Coemansia sp. RSA 1843]KAJ2089809.1 Transmembrane protein 42 [Coemansia sp. RSA 986]KAJ2214806.1 Transmembrane protein 42 [Coemansia sp. RSA 487]KAJ2569795.1 Transmembrane protein 42 [Coemansia sp. RSA 1813]